MAYCVNCGVKLAPQERKCPLCNTAAVCPSMSDEAGGTSVYPQKVEHMPHKTINLKYLSKLIAFAVLVAAALSLICDFIIAEKITWSIYVLGAAGFVSCLFAPVHLNFRQPYIPILIIVCDVLAYLLLTAHLNDGLLWYLYLAMPFLILTGLYTILCVALVRNERKNNFRSIGYCFLFLAFALILVEIIIDLYFFKVISLLWSICASIPIAAISVLLLVASANHRLMEEIKKRLFI